MNKRIVLIGNSTNVNRGCEAITRGSVVAFSQAAGAPIEIVSGVIVHSEDAARAVEFGEAAPGEPPKFPLRPQLESSFSTRLASRLFRRRRRYHAVGLAERLEGASSVLGVGGDNYTLDYGRPYVFVDLDREVWSRSLPLAIWGASIGPFSSDSEFETEILEHFRLLDRIYVRESLSYAYLTKAGLTNVAQMADPAIFMDPEVPAHPGFDAERFAGAVGLNLSPFQARQITGAKADYWATSQAELDALAEFGAQLLFRLLAETDRPVLLIPHVMAPQAWNNDRMLMAEVMRRLPSKVTERVALLPESYNAPQLKWALGRCSVFAGSRTHATLGAISSGVPTLAFGYSRKAAGLMCDLYGDDEMCLPGTAFTLDNAMNGLRRLIANENALRAAIAETLPNWREATLAAAREWLAVSGIV